MLEGIAGANVVTGSGPVVVDVWMDVVVEVSGAVARPTPDTAALEVGVDRVGIAPLVPLQPESTTASTAAPSAATNAGRVTGTSSFGAVVRVEVLMVGPHTLEREWPPARERACHCRMRGDLPRRVGTSATVLTSRLCTFESLNSPQFREWSDRLRPMWDPEGSDPRPTMIHRKMWEWLFICEALSERGMLQPGRRGLGFGVGLEPLVALFAGMGCDIVATDLHPDQARAAGWTESGEEYSGDLDGLNPHGLCPPEEFADRVRYRFVDMNDLPSDLRGFDFTWSSCAFEHLGDLSSGADFVVGQMDCLVPGGVAVHTTELNVSSEEETVESGATVLYRRRDIEGLAARLRRLGYRIDLDLREGSTPQDRHIDVPPFSDTHLRTVLGEFVTTSVGLVVERPEASSRRRTWWRR